jgi:hypothetical protein
MLELLGFGAAYVLLFVLAWLMWAAESGWLDKALTDKETRP